MASIAFFAFTRRGCRLAGQLAQGLQVLPEHRDAAFTLWVPARLASSAPGDGGVLWRAFDSLDVCVRQRFGADEALVFVGATGIAVRAIAPYLQDKYRDPAVVAVDEAGAFAVPVLSGHVGGANALARTIAGITAGRAVVSTATDVNGVFAVDEWAARRGLQVVERDIAKEISARLLEGGRVGFAADIDGAWDVPDEVLSRDIDGGADPGDDACDLGFVVSLGTACMPFGRTLHLVPRAVVVGVGCRKGVEPGVLSHAVDAALAKAGVSPLAVRGVASIDAKRGEPAIEQLAACRQWDVRYYPAQALRQVPGEFDGSAFVEQTVGVDNVCERAALATGGTLLLGKQAGDGVTVALGVVSIEPPGAPVSEAASSAVSGCQGLPFCSGSLAVVGLGPGGAADLTGRARAALAACDTLVGYPVYVDLVRDEFPGKEILTTPMRKEVERCRMALERAANGHAVALVCSGDPGVYGMAGLVLELSPEYPAVEVTVIPGVSASNGGAAMLGAPLMHDHCIISLSDLLTPWHTIERRLIAAASGDFGIVLYNPSSRKRRDHLKRACDILLRYLPAHTVCGIARNIDRDGSATRILSLGELRDTPVDMFTTVFIGNSQTREIGGRMVTPRGYRVNGDARAVGCDDAAERLPDAVSVPGRSGGADARGPEPEILLFGGTTEGRELAEWLSGRGSAQVVACCATDYGGELVSGLPNVQAIVGPLDAAAKDALVSSHDFACIVDATHPFATHISSSIANMAQAHGIPLIRLVREDGGSGEYTQVEDAGQAAAWLAGRRGNILLTTGTRDLAVFVQALDDYAERLYVRVLPVPESVEAARNLGIPASHIVAMQGPFSAAFNAAMLRELDIAQMVTKASGAAGGFGQKIEAAQACGVQAVVVGRPREEQGFSLEQVKCELEERYGV